MPTYMLQAAYTSDAWAAQVKNPQNRIEAIRPLIEGLGGKIVGAWNSFGDYDIVIILEMPDNTAIAAASIAASAGGDIKAINTTPLMTIEEGLEAMKKAGVAGYRPPGA